MTDLRFVRLDDFKMVTTVEKIEKLGVDNMTFVDDLPPDTEVQLDLVEDWDYGTQLELTVDMDGVEDGDGR